MNDRSIAKLSLAMTVVGLVGLFLVNLLTVPTFLIIGEIHSDRMGQIVTVDADVKRISHNDGDIFMTLVDETGEIRTVLWASNARDSETYNLSIGDAILATGQITNYRGELELVLSKIER